MERFIFQIFSNAHAFLISFLRLVQLCFHSKPIKHHFKIIIFLGILAPSLIRAQTALFGLTSGGNNGGVLFSTDADGRNQVVKYNFTGDNGAVNPVGGLVQATNGKIYGVTSNGGTQNAGTLFEFNPVSKTVLIKHSFGAIADDGNYPCNSKLTQATNGKLYGMTTEGGTNGYGIIYEFDLMTNSYSKLLDFNDSDSIGYSPQSGLLSASNGKLYGRTFGGKLASGGSLFEFDPALNTVTKIKTFKYNYFVFDFSLMQANDGKIYGTARTVNASTGIVFDYDPSTGIFTLRASLTTGLNRYTQSFVQAANGKLYGLIYSSTLRIIEFDPATNLVTVKYTGSITDGSYSYGPMILRNNGKLYGITYENGTDSFGTLFEYNPLINIFTKKVDFDYSTMGGYSMGNLLQTDNGKFYGTANSGGVDDSGVLFEYDTSGTITPIYNFSSYNQGSSPQSSLLFASDDLLYGTTNNGGDNYLGTVFAYDPQINQVTQSFSFDSINGSRPDGSLIQAIDGKLYGTASLGGANNRGTIYAYDHVSNGMATVASFDSLNGSGPRGDLYQTPNGLMYGMTYQGGSYNAGVIFSFNPTTTGITKLMDFNQSITGRNSFGNLVPGPGNKLYGMTRYGGSQRGAIGSNGGGTIFSLDPAGNTYTQLYNLSTFSGCNPYGSLTLANGLLYGLTYYGGNGNLGVLFSYDPLTSSFTKNIEFSTVMGTHPQGSLKLASNGKLYGMTKSGGANNLGTMFEYDPVSNALTVTTDFDGNNGANPLYGTLTEACIVATTIQQQPQNVNTCIGASIQLNVAANWVDYYQWYKNGTIIPGATGNVLTVTNVPLKSTYYCRLSNGCSTITSWVATVTGNISPTVNAGPSQLVCVGQVVQLSGTGTQGTAPASYYWFAGATGKDATFIAATITGITVYSFTGMDLYGCTAVDTLTINVRALPLPSVAGASKYICKGDLTSLSGSGAITYSWSGGITNNVPFTRTVPGLYIFTLTGTDANSCSNNVLVNLTVGGPALTISGTSAICKGAAATVSVAGANAYLWSNGSIASSIVVYPLSTTSYFITGTGSNGCPGKYDTASFVVNVNNPPTISISGNNVLCLGQSTRLIANGAIQYFQWPDNSNNSFYNITPNASTTIALIYQGSNGCFGVSMINITVISAPAPSVNGGFNQRICNGDPISFSGTGALSYSWSGGITNNVPFTKTVLGVYQYTLTGTDINLCSNTAVVNLTVTGPSVIINNYNDTAVCSGDYVFYDVTGADTYKWSNGSTNSFLSDYPQSTTTYVVTGTGSNGMCAGLHDIESVSITVYHQPVVTISGNNPICLGRPIYLIATGAQTYEWPDESFNSFYTATPAGNTTYLLTATLNGCSTVTSINVSVSGVTPLLSISGNNSICPGSFASLSVSGANTYQWSDNSNSPFLTVSPFNSTKYIVTGTGSGGCTNTNSIYVKVNRPSVSITGSSICNGNSATLTVNGADSYTWSNGSTGSSIVVSPTTTTSYVVTGTGSNGCTGLTDVNSIVVSVGFPPNVTISGNQPICLGQSIYLNASGASGYKWPGGSNTSYVTYYPDSNKSYILTSTGANGCSSTTMINVTVISVLPDITVSTSDIVCPGILTYLTATGANSYLWSDGSVTSIIGVTPLNTTDYYVTGIGDNGCSNTATATVSVTSSPTVLGTSTHISTCPCIPLTISVTATGVNPITYQWYRNGVAVASGETKNYDILSVTSSGENYTCVVSNSCTSVTSPGINVDIECSIPPVSQWIQLKCKLIGLGSTGGAQQGIGVAVSGDGKTAIVGGYQDNGNVGAAWIFTFNGNDFGNEGIKLVGTGSVGQARQGRSVNISGDGKTVIMGAIDDNNNIGAAWVFTFNGSSFVQVGDKLVGMDIEGKTIHQGASVALSADGKVAIVGGFGDNDDIGAAWVFIFNGTDFVQLGSKLTGYDSKSSTVYQGYAVDISSDGKTVVVGGLLDDNQKGAVWVYTFNGSNFVQLGNKILGDGSIGFAHVGRSVGITQNGKAIIFGAEADDAYNGATWVYTFNGTNYVKFGDKIVGDLNARANQGISVSISEDGQTAAIGGYRDNVIVDGFAKGATWVFTNSGTNFLQSSIKLVGTGLKDNSSQGISVGISGDGKTIFTGAYGDDADNGATWIFFNSHLPCYPPTILGMGPDMSACEGKPAIISSDAIGTGLLAYRWYLNNTELGTIYTSEYSIPSPSPANAGTYTCVVSNVCGSATSPGVNVAFYQLLTVSGSASPDPVCEGSEATITGFGAPSYIVSGGISTDIGFVPTISGVYTITSSTACSNIAFVKVNVKKLPKVSLDLSSVNNICDSLNTVLLTGGSPPGGTYLYEGAATNDLNISKAGNYEIIYRYFDSNQCMNTVSGILSAIVCTVPCDGPNPPCTCPGYTCPPPFKIYSAITPNNDGLNDTWLIDSLPPQNKVSIQDKWGVEVFKATNYNQDWDGKKENGHELPAGVYYYIVESVPDKKNYTGTISIIR